MRRRRKMTVAGRHVNKLADLTIIFFLKRGFIYYCQENRQGIAYKSMNISKIKFGGIHCILGGPRTLAKGYVGQQNSVFKLIHAQLSAAFMH